MGSTSIQITPAKIITSAIDMAKMGRRIKKSIKFCPFSKSYKLGPSEVTIFECNAGFPLCCCKGAENSCIGMSINVSAILKVPFIILLQV